MSRDSEIADFEAERTRDREEIERRLAELLEELVDATGGIREAMAYMVLGGGKRLRPLLCLWSHDAFGGGQRNACLDVGCALECVHTYSLIHDDLPCMDDDEIRRGKPSCHVRFGEATAVLTGDALLTLAFETVASLPERRGVNAAIALDVAMVIARAAGTHGLITGQALDLASAELSNDVATVEDVHRRKTASLIAAAMEAGAVLGGATRPTRLLAQEVGIAVGEAFQIMDDVLDIEMSTETLGKTSGKDQQYGRLTYPSVVGIPAARARAEALLEQGRRRFSDSPAERRLGHLLDTLVKRVR